MVFCHFPIKMSAQSGSIKHINQQLSQFFTFLHKLLIFLHAQFREKLGRLHYKILKKISSVFVINPLGSSYNGFVIFFPEDALTSKQWGNYSLVLKIYQYKIIKFEMYFFLRKNKHKRKMIINWTYLSQKLFQKKIIILKMDYLNPITH